MAETRTGWQVDPTGNHDRRYFSFDGRPTRLVMDGGFTSFDAPPLGLVPTSRGPCPALDTVATTSPSVAPPPATACRSVPARGVRRRGGRRLPAKAGIVLGLTALFGAGLAIAALQAHHSGRQGAPPTISAAGTTVNISSAHAPGIRTVTFWSLVAPADSGSVPAPRRGSHYAAAHIELCAGPAGTRSGPDLLSFELLLANGTEVKPNPASTSSPSLATFTAIGANSCIAGYVTFETASGTVPTLLRYEPDLLHDYEWRLPRPR